MTINMKTAALAVLFASISSMVLSAKPGFRITGDNAAEIRKYTELKADATKLLQQVDAEMKKSDGVLARYKAKGLSPEVPAQGRRFAELAEYANKKFGDALTQPLGQCGGLGIIASSYWQDRLSERDLAMLKRSAKTYAEQRRFCQEQIAMPPEATITVTGPASQSTAPEKGCLQVILFDDRSKTEWTCPKSLESKFR